MQFSKLVAIGILGFYFLAVTLSAIVFAGFDKNISFVLDYLQPLVSIVVISYFGKAGLENIVKLTKRDISTTSTTIDENKDVNLTI